MPAPWVVYSKPLFAGPKKLLAHLGRYTHRFAISNDRLISCDYSFFIKPTDAVSNLDVTLPERPPYNGAKPLTEVDELLDDPETLKRFPGDTAVLLPAPKSKKPKPEKPKT